LIGQLACRRKRGTRGEADSRGYVLSRAEYGQQPGGGIVYTDGKGDHSAQTHTTLSRLAWASDGELLEVFHCTR
jgi:hypothetical protein